MCKVLGFLRSEREALKRAVEQTARHCSHLIFIHRYKKVWEERQPLDVSKWLNPLVNMDITWQHDSKQNYAAHAFKKQLLRELVHPMYLSGPQDMDLHLCCVYSQAAQQISPTGESEWLGSPQTPAHVDQWSFSLLY